MISATEFRKDIYNLLDQVLKTGSPLKIKRKGKVLKIIPEKKVNKLQNLKGRKGFNGKPDDIIYMNWEKEWKPSI
jgi:hypothetical protein